MKKTVICVKLDDKTIDRLATVAKYKSNKLHLAVTRSDIMRQYIDAGLKKEKP